MNWKIDECRGCHKDDERGEQCPGCGYVYCPDCIEYHMQDCCPNEEVPSHGDAFKRVIRPYSTWSF